MLDFEYYGLAAIFILIGGLMALLNLWPKSVHSTFSQHAATNTKSAVFYALIFIVSSIPLYAYFSNVFNGRYYLDQSVTVLVSLALILQVACTFVIETRGKRGTIHRILAGLSAFVLTITQLTVGIMLGMISFWVSCALMVYIAIYVYRKRKKIQYALILQTLFYLAFFTPYIALSVFS